MANPTADEIALLRDYKKQLEHTKVLLTEECDVLEAVCLRKFCRNAASLKATSSYSSDIKIIHYKEAVHLAKLNHELLQSQYAASDGDLPEVTLDLYQILKEPIHSAHGKGIHSKASSAYIGFNPWQAADNSNSNSNSTSVPAAEVAAPPNKKRKS